MRIICKTKIDVAKKEAWPTLYNVPQMGSFVKSKSGMELRVDKVVYAQDENFPMFTNIEIWLDIPYPLIENEDQWRTRIGYGVN